MIRLLFRALCLLAALAGTPLRQAEAAGDLADALAELRAGHLAEGADGGVGDDAGDTLLNPPSAAAPAFAAPGLPAWLWLDARLRPTLLALVVRSVLHPSATPTGPAMRGHAWLQRFLF